MAGDSVKEEANKNVTEQEKRKIRKKSSFAFAAPSARRYQHALLPLSPHFSVEFCLLRILSLAATEK